MHCHFLTFSFVVPLALSLDRITLKQRNGGHRVFVDSQGRERIFHGTNAVVKGPPWLPDSQSFSVDISMAKEDFEWMQRLGLNALRLGVVWAGLEPLRGQYNESYLDEIDKIVRLAAAHGVYTLLDFHQDGFSEHFCGEGVPSWAVRRSEFSSVVGFPFPYQKAIQDFYVEKGLPGEPSIPTRYACGHNSHGPGWGEGAFELAQAYQALYSNWNGIGDAFAAMVGKVAARFAKRPEILGLELLNEPFAGDFYADPIIMVPFPSPENADAKNLQPLYDRANAAVRAVDDDVLLFFAGVTWDDFGVGFTAPPGGPSYANRSVIAYHFYEPPQRSVEMQFDAYEIAATRLQTAAFMTESDRAPGRQGRNVSEVGDVADAHLQSWTTWEWKSFYRDLPNRNESNSQLGAYGAHKTGNAETWNSPEMDATWQESYARTYAAAVAGQAEGMHFDSLSGKFELRYTILRSDPGVATQLFLWPERYPSATNVVVATSSSGQMRVEHDRQSGWAFVYPSEGVKDGSRVVIRIDATPAAIIV